MTLCLQNLQLPSATTEIMLRLSVILVLTVLEGNYTRLLSFCHNHLSLSHRIVAMIVKGLISPAFSIPRCQGHTMSPSIDSEGKRPIIIGNVAGAMEDCPHAM